MRSLRFVFCAACFLLGLFSSNLYAQSYTVLVADIQGLDTLIQLVKTMGEDMNVTFDMQKVPFARMISMIQASQFRDAHAFSEGPEQDQAASV
jgi:hypothetical protein